MPSDPLPSIYYIYFNNKIFHIEETVSAKRNGTVSPDKVFEYTSPLNSAYEGSFLSQTLGRSNWEKFLRGQKDRKFRLDRNWKDRDPVRPISFPIPYP